MVRHEPQVDNTRDICTWRYNYKRKTLHRKLGKGKAIAKSTLPRKIANAPRMLGMQAERKWVKEKQCQHEIVGKNSHKDESEQF